MYERQWSSIKNVPKMNFYFTRTPSIVFSQLFSLFLSLSFSLSLRDFVSISRPVY